MSYAPDAELLEGALAWVNKQRAKMGKRRVRYLRQGEQRVPWTCPVARSLGVTRARGGVFSSYWRRAEGDTKRFLPDVVRAFVARFDDGAFPELVSGTPTTGNPSSPESAPDSGRGSSGGAHP